LPIHKAYTSQTAPSLNQMTAPVARKSFLDFTPDELATVNNSLLHSYLTNFKDTTFSAYLVGTYQVINTRKLTRSDIIMEGIAVQFRAYLQPDEFNKLAPYPVVLELILPTKDVPNTIGYQKGDMIEINITPYFASLLHVGIIEQKDDDTIIRLTAVSLANRIKPPHKKSLSLKPPSELNLQARFPLFPNKLPPIKAPDQIE